MAVYDLEEQEQLDELKTWWKQYGTLVTGILLVVALAAAGWQGWNWWQRDQASKASGLYFAVQRAAAEGDVKRTREIAAEVIEKFPDTGYAGLAALVSAKLQVDKREAKNAKAQLQWAAEHAKDGALRDLARLRLAIVLADEKSYDAALQQLSVDPGESLKPRFAELKGDMLAAQGKQTEAAAAYTAALSLLEKMDSDGRGGVQGVYRELLQTKVDALGAAK